MVRTLRCRNWSRPRPMRWHFAQELCLPAMRPDAVNARRTTPPRDKSAGEGPAAARQSQAAITPPSEAACGSAVGAVQPGRCCAGSRTSIARSRAAVARAKDSRCAATWPLVCASRRRRAGSIGPLRAARVKCSTAWASARCSSADSIIDRRQVALLQRVGQRGQARLDRLQQRLEPGRRPWPAAACASGWSTCTRSSHGRRSEGQERERRPQAPRDQFGRPSSSRALASSLSAIASGLTR